MEKETVNGKAICDLPLCGIFAIAFVAGRPVEEMFSLYKKTHRKSNGWRGRTHHDKCQVILNKLGIEWSPVKGLLTSCSLAKWVEWHTVKGRTYIVGTGSHIQVVRDGIVHDQHGCAPIDDYRWKRSRVKIATLISADAKKAAARWADKAKVKAEKQKLAIPEKSAIPKPTAVEKREFAAIKGVARSLAKVDKFERLKRAAEKRLKAYEAKVRYYAKRKTENK